MTAPLSSQDFLEELIRGLQKRSINFVVAQNSLGYDLDEIFITDLHELIILVNKLLDVDAVRWVLELRTPLNLRITFFTENVNEFKLRILRAVSQLEKEGIQLNTLEQILSVQYPTAKNLHLILGSLEKWCETKYGKAAIPQIDFSTHSQKSPRSSTTESTFQNPIPFQPNTQTPSSHEASLIKASNQDLSLQLQNAIKTYWTEKYLARYLKISQLQLKELTKTFDIQREVCGHDVLYFFDRPLALKTYFNHILKGIFDEFSLKYEEISRQVFFLPNHKIAIIFFDGGKDQLEGLAEDLIQRYSIIFVVPEKRKLDLAKLQREQVQVIPLAYNQVRNTLAHLAHRSTNYALILK